ncbi:MAG: hypothetical protein K2G96_04060 [Clostridia bacterium]|nr:hypothetical protein [Clostridia bacterium]
MYKIKCYNLPKGKRFKLAWLRTGEIGTANDACYLSGIGGGDFAFSIRILAVRPALHTFTPPNRFTNLISLRYNQPKGKRLKLAWLRTGDYWAGSYTVDYQSGIGCAAATYVSKLLAVRPALHFYSAKQVYKPYIFAV